MMRIDRCHCFRTTFAELKAVAEAAGVRDVERLRAHAAFGEKCGLCRPYVRRMLRTGETVFREIVTEADAPEPRRAGG